MNEIKAAFRDTLEEKVLSAVPEDIEPQFSPRFERKMKRLSKRAAADHVPVRRAAALSLVIAAGFFAMSLPTVGSRQSDILLTEHAGYSELYFAHSDLSREYLEYVYEFVVPEGFEVSEEQVTIGGRYARYERGEEYLIIEQYTKGGFGGHFSTEQAPIVDANVNGCEGFCVDYGESSLLAWDNGDYFLELCGTLALSELRSIAESMSRRELSEEERQLISE